MSPRALRIAALAAALALAAPRAVAQAPAVDPASEVDFLQRLGEHVPLDLEFTDSDGRAVTLRELSGERPVLLTLVYYECPMLCTLVLNGLVRCLNAVSLAAGEDFTIVSVSIDPGEGPELAREKRAQYLAAYGGEAGPEGWRFLTGREEAIRALADAVGFRYAYDAERDEYAHASGALLLTPDGRISRVFYGVEFSPRDVRLGLVEASGGAIGTAIDRVLLTCYHYDPTTGRYGFVILAAIRVLGGLTVAAFAAFVVVHLVRERRRGRRSADPAAGAA